MAKTAALYDVFRRDFSFDLTVNPEYASQAGFHDLDGGPPLQSCSAQSYIEYAKHSRRMLDEVSMLEQMSGQLSGRDNLYLTIFTEMHREVVSNIESCPLYLLPINSIGTGCATYSFSESVEWMRFDGENDFNKYLTKLRYFPKQIEELIGCLKIGIETGYIASQAMCRKVAVQLRAIIEGGLDEFYAPIRGESGALLAAHPELLQALESAIETDVRSAYKLFFAFFVESYEPLQRSSPSVSSLPGGQHLYSVCLKYHTTTDLSPDEVHEIGLREVARIEQRYKTEVLLPLGFDESDFPGFVAHVASDLRFYVSSPEALLQVYERRCEQIRAKMPDYFLEFPKSPLEIVSRREGPAAFYLTGTADLKRPGRFQVNVSNIEKRPTYEAIALSLHEAIPGHHHQVSLALESQAPDFLRQVEDRRYEYCPCRRTMFSAYVEGWALYCEHLGEEMGLYEDPYSIYGRLSMEMMRSVRLVVDTGLHSRDWSIEQAMQYMQVKTGMHAHEVETEIYRYASWPGQACAYKVGQLEILRLRQMSEERLGPLFDLKEFHSIVLQCPLPLTVLKTVVEEYISLKVSY